MSGAQDIPEELHVLAGEYVLGALDAGEMRAVRRQAMVNTGLAAAIAGWEQRLAPITEAIPPMPPPDALWLRIAEAIAPVHDETLEAPPRPVAAPAREPQRFAPLVPPPEAVSFARRPMPPRVRPASVWPWQFATLASLALAAGIAALVFLPQLAVQLHLPSLSARFSPQVAALMPADSHTPGFLAEARPDGTVLLTAIAPVEVPSGKALELWIMPPGATAPRSLGVLPAAGRSVTLPVMPPSGTALLVSLEPPGGSPTGQPTGPVVYAGKLAQMRL